MPSSFFTADRWRPRWASGYVEEIVTFCGGPCRLMIDEREPDFWESGIEVTEAERKRRKISCLCVPLTVSSM